MSGNTDNKLTFDELTHFPNWP